jgi:hypothetical protein
MWPTPKTDNPIPNCLACWTGFPCKIDDGDHFDPSTRNTVDAGNPAGNVVPPAPRQIHIRYSTEHDYSRCANGWMSGGWEELGGT